MLDEKREGISRVSESAILPKYEITVLLSVYNSDFPRIKRTIESILIQKDISVQIVVADDGSENNYQKKIEELFEKNNFCDYKLVLNKENQGTVKNYITGLNVADGEYLKGISPGDYLYDNQVLKDWVDFLKASGKKWSFSDAIYYDHETGLCISTAAYPDNIKVYSQGDSINQRWNYVVVHDRALGAAILSSTDIQKQYITKIAEKGIVYGEDNMWRLMMFDDIVGSFYEKPTIYYEYGCGVSTTKNQDWFLKIRRDDQLTRDIMLETNNPVSFQIKMMKSIDPGRSLMKKIITKGLLTYRIKRKMNPRKSKTEKTNLRILK